jgi:hypothetical protein
VIKVSVLYPNQQGSRFDMDYYCSDAVGAEAACARD